MMALDWLSRVSFNSTSELEAMIEIESSFFHKIRTRLFFGRGENAELYSRDYIEKSKNNFVHIQITPSPKRRIASFEYGGMKNIGDNFESGYTILVTIKYDNSELRKYLIDILRSYGFGCLPTSHTMHCHLDNPEPNRAEAAKILAKILQDIATNEPEDEPMPEVQEKTCNDPRCLLTRQGVTHPSHNVFTNTIIKTPCNDARCGMNRMGLAHEAH